MPSRCALLDAQLWRSWRQSECNQSGVFQVYERSSPTHGTGCRAHRDLQSQLSRRQSSLTCHAPLAACAALLALRCLRQRTRLGRCLSAGPI